MLDTNGVEQWRVTVGALPDMVTFTPDGTRSSRERGRAAHYGSPPAGVSATYADPEGSVSIVDLARQEVTTVGSGAFADVDAGCARRDPHLRPGATPRRISSPSTSRSGRRCEGIRDAAGEQRDAEIDIVTGLVEQLVPLGYQHHDAVRIDTSDRELPGNLPQINVVARNANVLGMFLPDAIDSFETGGATYLAVGQRGRRVSTTASADPTIAKTFA